MRTRFGITLVELLTFIVALVVIAAVAIPLWRVHELRAQRRLAMDALLAVQAAQDRHFGRHARYADGGALDLALESRHYSIDISRGADELTYVATARFTGGEESIADSRCAQLGIDQHGRRFAVDDSGEDTSADCWARE